MSTADADRSPSAPTDGGRVTVELDVAAHMRDGVVLRANVYRPAQPGPWPVLLTRTPYCKDDLSMQVWAGVDPVQAARRGFMVVVQDVRGRFASDGPWEPYRYEREDGYDAVEWAARLPGSSGRVGMFSASYCGNTQWLAAMAGPPSLAAISPAMTWSEPMDGLLARGGAAELGVSLRWALEHGFDCLRRADDGSGQLNGRVEALVDDWDRIDEAGYWDLPVSDRQRLRRHGIPDLGGLTVLSRPELAEWSRVADSYGQVTVPSLNTAGWYDIFLQGTLDNYAGMVASGRSASLVVGPWTHGTFEDPIGDVLFGMRASRDGVSGSGLASWNVTQLAWLRRHLAPTADETVPEQPVRIFVMGRNEWREETEWPLSRAVEERWYLCRDGSLAPAAPVADGASSEFAYDPLSPVPTVGGQGVMSPGFASGPIDQRSVEARDDVLVFTSDVLRRDLEVTGRVRVVLTAQSSAPSTDWVVRLCDVEPDGRSINLCDGILRVDHGAGECRRYEIDLWSTSNVFLRGHRLRVQVTSSSFPRWDRNLNTGDQRGTAHVVAHQRIFHDGERSSYVTLPVVP